MEAPLPRLELAASDTEHGHSDDSAGEKEAKRQRSEPTTPVSTSSRHPWEYDAIMWITRVGIKEAERFEEDLDSTEYHDATEEPTRKEESEEPQLPKARGHLRGCGSSSLKECIELLNATVRNSHAPLDSGAGSEIAVPPHKTGTNAKRTNGTHFTRVHPPPSWCQTPSLPPPCRKEKYPKRPPSFPQNAKDLKENGCLKIVGT